MPKDLIERFDAIDAAIPLSADEVAKELEGIDVDAAFERLVNRIKGYPINRRPRRKFLAISQVAVGKRFLHQRREFIRCSSPPPYSPTVAWAVHLASGNLVDFDLNDRVSIL